MRRDDQRKVAIGYVPAVRAARQAVSPRRRLAYGL